MTCQSWILAAAILATPAGRESRGTIDEGQCERLLLVLRGSHPTLGETGPGLDTDGSGLRSSLGALRDVVRKYEREVLAPLCGQLLKQRCLRGGNCQTTPTSRQIRVLSRLAGRPELYAVPPRLDAAFFEATVASKSEELKNVARRWLTECSAPGTLADAAHRAAALVGNLDTATLASWPRNSCSLTAELLERSRQFSTTEQDMRPCGWAQDLLGWRPDFSPALALAVCEVKMRLSGDP